MSFDVVTTGDLVVDNYLPVPRFPQRDEDILMATTMKKELGGRGNFIIQAHRLGLKVLNISCVGKDEDGGFCLSVLKSEGINVSRTYIKKGKHTIFCWVLVNPKGEHVFIGVEKDYCQLIPEDIDLDCIRNSKIYYPTVPWIASEALKKKFLETIYVAHDSGVSIFFDPAIYTFLVPKEEVNRIISLSDIVSVNGNELKELTKTLSIDKGARKLLKLGPKLIAIKLGAQGCFLLNRDESIRLPAFPVKVVDTTCAGDAFNAGIVYGYLKNLSLHNTTVLANALGAIIVTKLGGGRGTATQDEVNKFLKANGIEFNF